jgi:hypothetical protein
MIMSSVFDMSIGMILGMIASPLLMKVIREIRQRRKVNKILHEISEQREEQ